MKYWLWRKSSTRNNVYHFNWWTFVGAISVFLSVAALCLAITSFVRSEQLNHPQHTNHLSALVGISSNVECSLCDTDTLANASTLDQAVFRDARWQARDTCRDQSSLHYFGTGTDHLFVATNTIFTLEQETYCATLVVARGAIVRTNGFRLFVRDRLILNGTVDNSGEPGLYATYSNRPLGASTSSFLSLSQRFDSPFPRLSDEFTAVSYVINSSLSADAITPPCDQASTSSGSTSFFLSEQARVLFSPDVVIAMQNQRGVVFTAGARGCPAWIIGNQIPLRSRAVPGGNGGGIIVIVAREIELGPDARIQTYGGSPDLSNVPSNDIYRNNGSNLLGRTCLSIGRPYTMYQFPGTPGGSGVIAIVTAGQMNRTRLGQVCYTTNAQFNVSSVPPMALECNATGFVTSVSTNVPFRLTYPNSNQGVVVLHDVCNNRAEIVSDNVDNDLDGMIDRRDDDGDGLFRCFTNETRSNVTSLTGALACDCDDHNSLSGNILQDTNHCGQCGNRCPTTAPLCRRGLCLPYCTSIGPINTTWTNVNAGVGSTMLTSSSVNTSIVNLQTVGIQATLQFQLRATAPLPVLLPGVITPTVLLRLAPRLGTTVLSSNNVTIRFASTLSHNCVNNSQTLVNNTSDANSRTFAIVMSSNNMTTSCTASIAVSITSDSTSLSVPSFLNSLRVAPTYSIESYSPPSTIECAIVITPNERFMEVSPPLTVAIQWP